MTPTELKLLVLFRHPVVHLDDVSEHYLGLSPLVARQRAGAHRLPFPTFRLTDSPKAPVLVKVSDLAAHIDSVYADNQVWWARSRG